MTSVTDTEPELVETRHGNVVVLRLNRPEARNALSPGILHGLGRAIIAAEADPEIRAIVLTGTGDRAFCAGMDLRAFASGDGGGPSDPEAMKAFGRFIAGDVAVPLVGAAQATAVAGGLEVLTACDVIVASSEAKFGLPEVKRGLFAAGGGTALGRKIPIAFAMELLLTGDTIDAQRAREIGLINVVVEPDQVLTAALELAERIAVNGPLALAATKELARLALVDPDRYQQRHGELQKSVFASDDAKEGATAFIERRPAVWTGR